MSLAPATAPPSGPPDILIPGHDVDDWDEPIRHIGDLDKAIDLWQVNRNIVTGGQSLSRIWYRGLKCCYPHPLRPKIYRDPYLTRSRALFCPEDWDHAGPSLTLERHMLKEFRTAGAVHFDSDDIVEVFFTAQHFGMPTRLLDWTMNPLIALFFAVKDCQNDDPPMDGAVIMMDAVGVLPAPDPNNEGIPASIPTMRNEFVTSAIQRSFWIIPDFGRDPIILPVRPDNRPGRMGQQSACFTLHMDGAEPKVNDTAYMFTVPHENKPALVHALRRMNINEYTIYNDLDSLSRTACDLFGVPR